MKTCAHPVFRDGDWEDCGKIAESKERLIPLCATHARSVRKLDELMQKQAEKRKALLSKPKKIYKAPNKVSDKRKIQNQEYSVLRDEFLKEHPNCELKLLGCKKTATQIHHTASGWNKSTNLNNVKTWKASCDHCNQFLHDKISAKEARELGLKI